MNAVTSDAPQGSTPGGQLPPPPPPPPGAPGGPDEPRRGDEAADDHHDLWRVPDLSGDLDLERVKLIGKWWLGPLRRRDVWMDCAYLLVTLGIGWWYFVASLVAGVVTFGLLFALGAGVLLIVPWFRLVDFHARTHARVSQYFDHPVGLREPAPLDRGFFGRIGQAFGDPVRWRRILWVGANMIFGAAIAGLGIFPGWVALSTFFGGGVTDLSPFGPGLLLWVPLLLFFLGLFPRTVVSMAVVRSRLDNWALGTGRLQLAEQRASALAVQRDDVLDAVASERRRIERNLHDGVQQQLVAIGLDLGMAEHQLARNPEAAKELLVSARQKVQGSIGELRQIGRGLHPAILGDRGLDAALSAVVAGAPIPIAIHVDPSLDLGRDLEETIYFVVNEAVANVLKHAEANVASVHVLGLGDRVRVIVHDDGRGGASAGGGTGLAGMRARIHGLDGTFQISSPSGGPTSINAEVPIR